MLPFKNQSVSQTYLYGMSDFWASMFLDSDKTNLLLEATSFQASEIYNRFLQLASGISLEDIATWQNSQIELVYLSDSDLVTGTIATYTLPSRIHSTKEITNRPFLATKSWKEGVDFYIDIANNTISFAKPLLNSGFISRELREGGRQYALWFIDSETDNDQLFLEYGKLIGIEQPNRITETFKSFVEGIFFVYVNGPNLDIIKKGLNLTLGIPLARDSETVLEIRKYLESDQYIIITDLNSYLIPYGVEPSVTIDQVLSEGDSLANWVEVKDYVSDGEWWVNLRIPEKVVPHIPDYVNRYATPGSYMDGLMRDYLKTHTFLVNVRTTVFKNEQDFSELAKILQRVKPTHTYAVYIWSVPILEEELSWDDSEVSYTPYIKWCDNLTTPIERLRMDSDQPLLMGCPTFTLFCAPAWLDDFLGRNTTMNGDPYLIAPGVEVTGYINQLSQFRTNTELEDAWMRVFMNKGLSYYLLPKDKLSWMKRVPDEVFGTGKDYLSSLFPGYRIIKSHITTEQDILTRFSSYFTEIPDSYVFTALAPEYLGSQTINTHSINSDFISNSGSILETNRITYFTRDSAVKYLGPLFPSQSYYNYIPGSGEIMEADFLVFVRVMDGYIGVAWATTNMEVSLDPYYRHEVNDKLAVTIDGGITAGLGIHGQPCYVTMGILPNYADITDFSINGVALNESFEDNTIPTVNYSDTENTIGLLDLSGNSLTYTRTWV